MSDEIPLSERVRLIMFAFPHDEIRRNRVSELADEIATMAQRLAEAEAENAELRSFVDEVEGNVVDAIEAATEDMQENTHD